MIIKERKIPLKIKEINEILNRLPVNHPKRTLLEEEVKSRWKGYRGEKQVDYHLEFLDSEKYLIFNNIRLIFKKHAFQIDTLIMTPFFLLITEIKNISGEIYFEKGSNQVIRKIEDKEDGFQNPILQVSKQRQLLQLWLRKHRFPDIPVEDLVVFSDRKTIIKTTKDNYQIFNKVIFADVLVDKINQFKRIYSHEALNSKQLQKLKKLILKEHTPEPPSALQKFGIMRSELRLGSQCLECHQFYLIRQKNKWFCPKCQSNSKKSHIKAIYDYFLIVNTTISNKQCREFLLIESPNTAKKLLKAMNLPTSGSNKNRVYHRPLDFD